MENNENQLVDDGKLLTAGVSGFEHYKTLRSEVPDRPVPVLTPADLLKQINELKIVLNLPDLKYAISLLYQHINDLNNPHQTKLSDYLDSIIDVFYNEFLKAGGKGSRERYIECLFATLRIATLSEMYDESSNNLLVSIQGAKRFIDAHEKDPNAHSELLELLMPGESPEFNPVLSVHAFTGLSSYWMRSEAEEKNEDFDIKPYSYIGQDGLVHHCDDTTELPTDFGSGLEEPLVPCFGTRINNITNSCDFSTCNFTNTKVDLTTEILDPEGNRNASVITSFRDTDVCLHKLLFPEVVLEMNKTRTFSIFAKAGTCRYLAIGYKDMIASPITSYGIYDLQGGGCITINNMGRYGASIVKLTNGWYRCELSMRHEIGQISDVQLIPFKEKTEDWSFDFQANRELCTYIWGAQLEDGINASPYIPTNGKASIRYPVSLEVELDKEWWTPDDMTIHCTYVAPKPIGTDEYFDKRHLFAIRDEHNLLAANAWYTSDCMLYLYRYDVIELGDIATSTLVFQDLFEPETEIKYHQFTHSISYKGVVSLLNETSGLNIAIPSSWSAGNTLYIGNDGEGNYLESYIRTLEIYPHQATKEEAIFMNGEQIYE